MAWTSATEVTQCVCVCLSFGEFFIIEQITNFADNQINFLADADFAYLKR
jgi:hypothetical protein